MLDVFGEPSSGSSPRRVDRTLPVRVGPAGGAQVQALLRRRGFAGVLLEQLDLLGIFYCLPVSATVQPFLNEPYDVDYMELEPFLLRELHAGHKRAHAHHGSRKITRTPRSLQEVASRVATMVCQFIKRFTPRRQLSKEIRERREESRPTFAKLYFKIY